MPKPQQQILEVLNNIQGSGAFCVKGKNKFKPPGLSIEGFGEVPLPLTDIVAKALIAHAHKASFGIGSKTVKDTNVRSTWEIDAEKIHFANPVWKKLVTRTTAKVIEGLGMQGRMAKANLYKLLLYQQGDFFLPHRDSEKEDGMFATLILSLPCSYTAGALHIRFAGQEEVIDFSDPENRFQIPYVAFYADCEHEVKEVESGYRLCLVYNLIQKDRKRKITAPENGAYTSELIELLNQLGPSLDREPLTYVLSHRYTPSNFSMSALKNHDARRVEALKVAAEQAGYFYKLGLISIYQMGDLDGNWMGNPYVEYDAALDEENSHMGEIYEEYTEFVFPKEDQLPDIGYIEHSGDHVIGGEVDTFGEPHEKEADTYTGNAGMTMEYWYHFGAFFCWPIDKHEEILSHRVLDVQVGWLSYYLKHWQDEGIPGALWTRNLLIKLAKQRGEPYCWKQKCSEAILQSLLKLDDKEFYSKCGVHLVEDCFQHANPKTVANILEKNGTAHFENWLDNKTKTPLDNTEFLQVLLILKHLRSRKKQELTDLAKIQLAMLGTEIQARLSLKTNSYSSGYPNGLKRQQFRQQIIEVLLTFSIEEESDDLVNNLYQLITGNNSRSYQVKSLLPAIRSTSTRTKLYNRLAKLFISDLEDRVSRQPQAPSDWKREMPMGDGKKVSLLRDFMNSPKESVYNFKAVQHERSQMENSIRKYGLDLDMQTIRKGSPHTLRLTKNSASYERALKKWKEDVALLEELQDGPIFAK